MPNDLDFSGKVALVTGSSRGIGAGILKALCERGARGVVNYVADRDGRNRADADALAKELGAALVECDVGDPEQVARLAEALKRDVGGVDILVNNAGVLRDRSLRKISLDEWDSVLRVNLSGPFHVLRQLVQADLIRDGGRVVNVASIAATLGFFGQANYASSKAGVIALTKVAARELAKRQITVNAIAPGVIETEMSRSFAPEVTQSFLSQVPLGRLGSIDDVVGAALWLCSDLARYVTGQVIHVNGGLYMGTA